MSKKQIEKWIKNNKHLYSLVLTKQEDIEENKLLVRKELEDIYRHLSPHVVFASLRLMPIIIKEIRKLYEYPYIFFHPAVKDQRIEWGWADDVPIFKGYEAHQYQAYKKKIKKYEFLIKNINQIYAYKKEIENEN